MNVLKLIAAIVVGWLVGSAVNMGIIIAGPSIIPLPEPIIPGDMESLAANVHLLEFKHFITPFLAHALGALVGAFVAALLAARNKLLCSLVVGGLFQLGGIAMAFMVDSPLTYDIVDLIFAYFPMAFIGYKIATIIKPESPE